MPNTTLQQTTSPDISTVSNTLYNWTSWTIQHALSSDHLPIITTINIRHDYRLQQNRRTFTNYKKADWTQFPEDTESAFAQTTIPTNIHTATKPMEGTLRCTLGSHAQHAHSLEDHTRSIQQSTSTHTKHIHNIQQLNSNHTQTHCELFHQTIHKHATHKTNRYTNRATHKIQGYNITLTTTQVQEAIKQSKNNNSQVPDKLNIRHLKHIGPLELAFLTSMLKTYLNTNIIAHIWKLANIVPIPKPNKDIDKGTLYRTISLLSVIAKTPEKSLLPYITANIPNTPTQHRYKIQHSTVTELHTVNHTVAKGFNQMAPHA